MNCAKEAIDKCEKSIIFNYIDFDFEINYNNYDLVKYILDSYKNNEAIIKNIDFGDNINISLKVVDFKIEEIKSKIRKFII